MQLLSDDVSSITRLPDAGGITKPDVIGLTENCHPQINAKFLSLHGQRFYIRGTSYGSFAQTTLGVPFPLPALVRQDFDLMRSIGINTVRLYDLPPTWLLEMAWDAG